MAPIQKHGKVGFLVIGKRDTTQKKLERLKGEKDQDTIAGLKMEATAPWEMNVLQSRNRLGELWTWLTSSGAQVTHGNSLTSLRTSRKMYTKFRKDHELLKSWIHYSFSKSQSGSSRYSSLVQPPRWKWIVSVEGQVYRMIIFYRITIQTHGKALSSYLCSRPV